MDWEKAVLGWRKRAKSWKESQGVFDADIAAIVVELRRARGDEKDVGRAAVNHWVTRTDREPNLRDFLDWCIAARADPRHILFDEGHSQAPRATHAVATVPPPAVIPKRHKKRPAKPLNVKK